MGLGKDLNFKFYRNNQVSFADLCVWDIFLDERDNAEGVCVLKGNALMCAFEFIAPDVASSTAVRIASIANNFNYVLTQLGDGWTVQFELQRKLSNEYPESKFNSLAGYMIEASRKKAFEGSEFHFENRYFLTLTYRLPSEAEIKGASFFNKKSGQNKVENERKAKEDFASLNNQIQEFLMMSEKAVSTLNTIMDIRRMSNDELFTYIHSSVSTDWGKRFYPSDYQMYIDSAITDVDLHNSMPLKLGNMYIPIVAICGFPSATIPAMFDVLNKADVPLRWSTRFECLGKEKAEKQIQLSEKHWRGNRQSMIQKVLSGAFNIHTQDDNAGAEMLENDAKFARAELYTGNSCFGNYCSNIMLMSPDLKVAEEAARYIMGLVSSTGFSCKEENFNALHAFLSMMPGNIYANTRTSFCSSTNVSHIVPASSIWSGMRENAFLGEISGNSRPLVTCQTEFGIPFFLNLNLKDVGHTWISGPTSAGKSTFLALLEAQWLKYPHSRVIIFDKDRSARCLTMCVGGNYIEPGKDNTAFQPLADIDTPEGQRWAADFITMLLLEQHTQVTPLMRKAIFTTITLLSKKDDLKNRTLTSFCQYCTYKDPATGNNDIVDSLSPYLIDGNFGQLFDSDNAEVPIRDWTMIEMGSLMNMSSAVIGPALFYLFHECEKKFDGKPTLLILDEAWIFLKNPMFAEKIVEWLKTLRKKNVFVIFATQEVDDAAKSPIASTILSQCASQIFLPDEKAATKMLYEAYTKFGLEDNEIRLLSDVKIMQRKRDYYYKSPVGTRIFQLGLDRLQLGILTTSSEDHKMLDYVEKKYGKNTGKELVREILTLKKIPYKEFLPRQRSNIQ